MKKIYYILQFIFCISLVAIVSITSANAQDENLKLFPRYTLGTYFSFKAGVNGGNTPEGRQNGLSFNGIPDFGLIGYFPFDVEPDLGLLYDIGYNSYSFKMKSFSTDEKFTESFSYFSISARFFFTGFFLGFGINFPVRADFGATIDNSKLQTNYDVKLGWMYNVRTDEVGEFNVFVQGSYMLNGIFKDFGKDDPLKPYIPAVPPEEITNSFNPRAASLTIGINYMFNLYFQ